MNNIMFSVCVITYNQEQYIVQTLDSIMNQKHNYSYEIVIGEDCSTDNTKKVLLDYVEKYPGIIKPIFNNPNKGLLKNYYNTLSNCKGKYIMECAGDDYWLPGKVEKQIAFMESHPEYGMCYGNKFILEENKKKLIKDKSKGFEDYCDLINYNCIPAASVCYRNNLLKNYIESIEPLKQNWLMEDYPMWLWFSKNSKIKYLNEDFITYRVIDDSISNQIDIDKQVNFQKSVCDVRNYYKRENAEDEIIFDANKVKFDILMNRCLSVFNYECFVLIKQMYKEYNFNDRKSKIKLFILSNKLLRFFYKLLK